MYTFDELGLTYVDLLKMIAIAVVSFFITYLIYPKYINFAKKKGWIGKDIHKHDRPEVAESGGAVFIIGLIPAFIMVYILYPQIRNETLAFAISVLFSGVIGFIDDRKVLSSYVKLFFMIMTGFPIFILNYFKYIEISDPVIPILGKLSLSFIYPIMIPIIIAILTNLVNMLEGYNGEGSGTALIVIGFLFIGSIISKSSEGLIFSLLILGALAAFFKFNKYPAKVFPGDVGTLAIGAAIGCVAIFGSMEVAMFCCILVHLFNGFYVVASVKGLKERHTIKTKDIVMLDNDVIEATKGKTDLLTLPRLLLATKPLTEPQLVKQFWALGIIGGLFALIAGLVNLYTLGTLDLVSGLIGVIIILLFSVPVLIKFKAIRGVVYFYIALLGLGFLFLMIADLYIIPLSSWFAWLIIGIMAVVGFFYWYYLTIKYFWYKISKLSDEKIHITFVGFTKDTINYLVSLAFKIVEKVLKVEQFDKNTLPLSGNDETRMHKLKICFVSLTTYPDAMDGSAKFLKGIFDELKNRGHDVTLLTAKWTEGFNDPNIKAINIPSLRILWVPKFAVAFRKYLKENEFDIIHSNGSRPSIPILLSGKPYIATIHDVGPFQATFTKIPGLKWLEKKNAKDAKYIITCADSGRGEISKFMKVSLDKIHVVSSAIDPKFKPSKQQGLAVKESLQIKGPVIYYVGRIAFYKGIEDIIKAYKIAKKEIPDLNLVIGGKPEIRLQSEYEQWKTSYPDVKFMGTIKDEEMAAYYSMADIFTTYSFASEGFGLTPVEAMACGTPVICSNLPAYKEVLKEYATFIEPKQPELLAKAFITQIKNPDIGKQQVKSASGLLKQYTWKNVVDNIELVYQKYLETYSKK
jgi:UDP-N-acetylglucosamine--dolichyl-phosphate N-acetylglucosaminephosphotransferase